MQTKLQINSQLPAINRLPRISRIRNRPSQSTKNDEECFFSVSVRKERSRCCKGVPRDPPPSHAEAHPPFPRVADPAAVPERDFLFLKIEMLTFWTVLQPCFRNCYFTLQYFVSIVF